MQAGSGVESCPVCNSPGVRVMDSRVRTSGRSRRKRCERCGHRWSTIEVSLEEAPTLVSDEAIVRAEKIIADAIDQLSALRSSLIEFLP